MSIDYSDWKLQIVRWLNREKIEFLFDAEDIAVDALQGQDYLAKIIFWKEKITKILQDSIVNEKNYNELLKTIPTFECNYKAMKAMLELDDFDFYNVFDENKICQRDYSKEYFLMYLNKMEEWFEEYQKCFKRINEKNKYWKSKWEKNCLKHYYLNDMLTKLYPYLLRNYNSVEDVFNEDYIYENALRDFEFIQGIGWGIKLGLTSYGFRFNKNMRTK